MAFVGGGGARDEVFLSTSASLTERGQLSGRFRGAVSGDFGGYAPAQLCGHIMEKRCVYNRLQGGER